MKNWISFPLRQGTTSRQAHATLPPDTYEREIGREGFFGPATHLHHKHPPTDWLGFEGNLRPRAFDLNVAALPTDTPWKATPILGNSSACIRVWHTSGNMDHLVRNADGDELLFFHEGDGELFCDYGHLSIEAGDYVLLPRGTAWRLDAAPTTTVLMIEATNDSYRLPDKGMVGPHALFDPAIFDVPQIDERFIAQQDDNEWRIDIKRRSELTRQFFPFNPLDATGWHGNLAVTRVNWRDIRPLCSPRYHLPPSAHTTFVAGRFVVCTFVPRPLETAPDALKLPFYHSNDDFDEFVFYHQGQFMSRDNIKPGMATFHPFGFVHGPHPKAYETAQNNPASQTDEVAVMVDTRDPMDVCNLPGGVEQSEYVDSWRPKK